MLHNIILSESFEVLPEWASFFQLSEYQFFLISLDQYLKEKNLFGEVLDGVLRLENENAGFQQLGLLNIAQTCKQAKPEKYLELIEGHFEGIAKTNAFFSEFEKEIPFWEKVKYYISVRLYPRDYTRQLGRGHTSSRPLTEEIDIVMVYDLSDSIINVQPKHFENWDITEDELFELGKNNVKARYEFHVQKEEFEGYYLYHAFGEHFFTGNIVFELDKKEEFRGFKGCLVSIPHRHSVIIYPINDFQVITALNHMFVITHGMNLEGPGSISNEVYWYYRGTFTKIPYEIKDSEISVIPPQSFVDMLEQLHSLN